MSGLGVRRVVVLRSGLQVTEVMSPAARARAASAVRASVERGDWRDEEPTGALLGIAIVPMVFDPETSRSSCGSCGRTLVSGQVECVCGARFAAPPIEVHGAAA